jgi:hypothetical protein
VKTLERGDALVVQFSEDNGPIFALQNCGIEPWIRNIASDYLDHTIFSCDINFILSVGRASVPDQGIHNRAGDRQQAGVKVGAG